ncbi:MAG: helicase-related protein [Verrucomicrobiota bacterium]
MEIAKAIPGQRLVSDSEPELGLGIVLKVEFGRIEMFFPAASEQRQYSIKSAPLRRVQFKEGDKIKLHSGEQLSVDSVIDNNGLLTYIAAGREITEAQLSDFISFSKPEDRLFGAQVDENHVFELRAESLLRRTDVRKSPVRGFLGGRVDLIPHQMFIAAEVASRLLPRVLLADEVGLGKTIEAGLTLHRLHLTGRAERILILLPEPLIHQWFVELWRRFNLLFSIYDVERCESIELNQPGANPFLESQLVICSIAFLSENPDRSKQVLEAGWDLLVVDEAHHLEWHPDAASPQYELVEALSAKTPGLLLLTATPQQLGPESHFARLRLLDPNRYTDLEKFQTEADHYEQVAQAVDRLLAGKTLSAADKKLFTSKSPHLKRHLEQLKSGDESARSGLVSALLDSFGTGRVMFRNTRAALSGFPERKALLAKLKTSKQTDLTLLKLKWLAGLLKAEPEEKFLLICASRKLAEKVHEGLLQELNVPSSIFHEGLTLVQRDRNAAYFAEEDGARILICSEIGSEGRNFQFAHHLVLFDLPRNPELLEQRIGRLDRIGQTETIQIHVPYFPGDESEVLAKWYDEGLNAFEKNVHGAAQIAAELVEDLDTLLENPDTKRLKVFLAKTKELRANVTKKLERGHDRLLELNSCRPEKAESTIEQIRASDESTEFENFFIRLADFFGVNIENLDQRNRSHLLTPGHLMKGAFPCLPDTGLSITFQRARALSREDLTFMSPDHPMVHGALDLLLSSESGNTAFGVWKNSGKESLLLECYLVVECVAPANLHLDRFLPVTPIRILVDHALTDLSDDDLLEEAPLEEGEIAKLLDKGAIKKKLLPAMFEKSQTLGAEKMAALVIEATAEMDTQLQKEIERLEDLRAINDHVSQAEIDARHQEKESLRTALASARLRLDAIRLILRMA